MQCQVEHMADPGPRHESEILNEANYEFNTNNFDRAEELYTQFINTCTTSGSGEREDLALAHNNRGQVKYCRVDFHAAMEDYTAAIEAHSRFEIPYYNRGLILYRLGSFEDAERDFRKALEINGDFEDAKLSLHQTTVDREEKLRRGY